MRSADLEAFVGLEVEDRYRLQGVLALTPTGLLFEADECLRGRLLAHCCLKISSPGQSQEVLLREAAVLARLTHPRVIAFRGAGEIRSGPFEGGLYLATELGDSDLNTPVGASELARCARHASEALGALQGQSYVHGDLEPGNLVCTPIGWKLAGFASTRTLKALAHKGPHWEGKAAYRPPETYGAVPGFAADMWSLGAVLQEAHAAYLKASVEGRVAGPTEPLPEWLASLLRGCQQPDPSGRPSPDDLLELLDCFERGQPPEDLWLERARALPPQAALARLRIARGVSPSCAPKVARALRELLATRPGRELSAELLRELGEVSLALGDRQTGLRCLEESRQLAPQDLQTLTALGELHLAEAPDHLETLSLLAGLYYKRGWWPRAAALYRRLQTLHSARQESKQAEKIRAWLASLPDMPKESLSPGTRGSAGPGPA